MKHSEYSANEFLQVRKMPVVKVKKPNHFWLISTHIFILIMCLPIVVMLLKGVI